MSESTEKGTAKNKNAISEYSNPSCPCSKQYYYTCLYLAYIPCIHSLKTFVSLY